MAPTGCAKRARSLHLPRSAAKLGFVSDPNQDGKSPLSGIGATESKSPLDRIRQIQQMQEAAAAQEVGPRNEIGASHVSEAAAAAEVATPSVADEFAVKTAAAVKADLNPKVDMRHIGEIAKRQVDAQSLFGGGGVELKGNPWKVISFNDGLPALFDPPKPMASYEPVVPKNAVNTAEGLLFQVGLKAKDNSEKPLVKTVLTSLEGKLKGAECKAPQDLERLLTKAPGFFETLFGFGLPKGGVAVRTGSQSRFEADIPRPAKGGQPAKTEKAYFNNFGQLVAPAKDFAKLDFVQAYNLDEFEAGF